MPKTTVNPKPSKARQATAEAEEARRAHERRYHALEQLGYEAFEALDRLHRRVALDPLGTGEPSAAELTEWETECDQAPLWAEGDSTEKQTVAAALDVLADAEHRLETARRMARVLVGRAERLLRAYRRQLLPAVEAWANANRPKKGKTIRFDETSRHLQWRMDQATRLTVPRHGAERQRVIDWVAQQVEYNAALENGLLEVREHLDETKLRQFVEDHALEEVNHDTGEITKHYPVPPGCTFEEKQERLRLRGVTPK